MSSLLTIALLSISTISELNYPYLFHHYQNEFNKNYSIDEYGMRFDIFRDNVDFIFNENNKNQNYTLGFNHFTDLTSEEFSQMFSGKFQKIFGNGCNKMEYKKDSVPKSLDWRDHNAVTPVKNQGQCGSCWSFSTTGALEGSNSIINGDLTSLSEQELVDCSSKYGNMGCNGGLMDNAFSYVKDNGLCTEESYSYDGEQGTCQSSNCTPVVYVENCFDVPHNNELALKEAVAKQPVSVAIEADTRVFQMYHSGVLTSDTCGTNLDHGVLTVGYGTDENSGIDYWLVKNSWGPSWGDEGYIKIERSDSTSSPGTCGIAMQPSYPVVSYNKMYKKNIGGVRCGDCGLSYQACCFSYGEGGYPCNCHLEEGGTGQVGSECGDCGVEYGACCIGFREEGDPCNCDIN